MLLRNFNLIQRFCLHKSMLPMVMLFLSFFSALSPFIRFDHCNHCHNTGILWNLIEMGSNPSLTFELARLYPYICCFPTHMPIDSYAGAKCIVFYLCFGVQSYSFCLSPQYNTLYISTCTCFFFFGADLLSKLNFKTDTISVMVSIFYFFFNKHTIEFTHNKSPHYPYRVHHHDT